MIILGVRLLRENLAVLMNFLLTKQRFLPAQFTNNICQNVEIVLIFYGNLTIKISDRVFVEKKGRSYYSLQKIHEIFQKNDDYS